MRYTKKAHTMEELFMYLEALEMLDMIYTIQKFPREELQNDEVLNEVWVIKYTPQQVEAEPAGILFED